MLSILWANSTLVWGVPVRGKWQKLVTLRYNLSNVLHRRNSVDLCLVRTSVSEPTVCFLLVSVSVLSERLVKQTPRPAWAQSLRVTMVVLIMKQPSYVGWIALRTSLVDCKFKIKRLYENLRATTWFP